MKVFVTGGAGYIGSVVAELLLDRGHDVVVFDNFSTGHRAAVDPRAALVCGDTGDPLGVRDAMVAAAPDVVVHMAAYIQMGESMHNPGKYFRNNAANTLNVLDAMLAAKGTACGVLVHCGSVRHAGRAAGWQRNIPSILSIPIVRANAR